MAEIEKTPDLITGDDIGSNVLDHTAVADSFINVDSGDPTVGNDTGQGYVVGSLWVNSTSGDVFQAIGVGAENASWANQEGDDINISPAWQALSYGYETGGGNPAHSDEMSRWPIAAPYPSADIGTLPAAMYGLHAGVYGSTLFLAGGRITPVTARGEVATFAAAASASITDVGEMNESTTYAGCGWSATKGYVMAGNAEGSATTTIQDYTFASPFAATDVAEHANDKENPTSHDDDSYTWNAMGGPPQTDMITRYAKSTTDNSTDVGEATVSKYAASGNTDNTNAYGFITGGATPEINELQRFPFSSPASSTDVAEHSSPLYTAGGTRGVSTLTHGFTLMRDDSGGEMERFSFTAPYPSADVGEAHASVSDNICCHGV